MLKTISSNSNLITIDFIYNLSLQLQLTIASSMFYQISKIQSSPTNYIQVQFITVSKVCLFITLKRAFLKAKKRTSKPKCCFVLCCNKITLEYELKVDNNRDNCSHIASLVVYLANAIKMCMTCHN